MGQTGNTSGPLVNQSMLLSDYLRIILVEAEFLGSLSD